MKIIICVSVLLIVLFQLTSTVTVTEGDFQFSLEAVKALGKIIPMDEHASLQEVVANAANACLNPDLPPEFGPLCLRKDATASLARLATVAFQADACEICESVACTGC